MASPPPSASPSSPTPLSPGAVEEGPGCATTCTYTGDGECDDGGEGSDGGGKAVGLAVETAAPPPLSAAEIEGLAYRELQAECKARGLGARGKADELLAKLLEAVALLSDMIGAPQGGRAHTWLSKQCA